MADPTHIRTRSGVAAGAIAALLATIAMMLLVPLAGVPSPLQLIADRLTTAVPVDVFGALLGSLESRAKPLAFAAVILGAVVLGGVAGALAARALRRGLAPGVLFLVLTAVTWALFAGVVAPLGGIGLVGRDGVAGAPRTGIGFLVIAVVFAAVLLLELEEVGGAGARDPGRRRILRLAGFGIPAALAAVVVARAGLRMANESAAAPAPAAGTLVPPVTPTEDFYIVSKNFFNPRVALGSWQLTVDGRVERPRAYTYEELRARPAVRQITTLECISNPIGGHYISTGEWTGVPLRELLAEVGLQPGVVDIVLHAADDYADSIPLVAAMDPDTMLVYDLNGAPLEEAHGFPLRLIVPGIFGMKNVKWITRIEAVDRDFRGYWQQQGWSDVATVQTMSRIDVPADGRTLPAGQPAMIGGIAFAGDRGISRVEVSTDGGKGWAPATLNVPPSPLTWVLWTYQWMPVQPGTARILARAYDGSGAVQDAPERPPLPDGATGYHSVRVHVRGAA
ncbi:MAG: molybdopterin-dependent oxidoreductase [Sphaerobacter sp.]|nr:molybdopterin-dependent oxidoreductase [Sphaerobacter sp.]